MAEEGHHRAAAKWRWYSLLLIPFVAILWVPFYAEASPELAGIPYFYWYQFLWVLISAVITALVYVTTREPEQGVTDGEVPTEGLR
jgi:membrane protein implicated in regulation of membrane protease activity